MSTISAKAKKRWMIAIVAGEDETGISLLRLFRDRDNFESLEVTSGNFKNIIEKVVPSISRDEVNGIFHDYQKPGVEKANYDLFLKDLTIIRKKKKVLTDILDQILDQFTSKDNTLFDLFESADKNGDGVLSRREFLNIFNEFGIYYDEDQMDDFFYFLDTNSDGGISYRELQSYFTKLAKSRGKDMSELTRASFFKDPKNYWGRKIFEEANKYLTQKKMSLPDFFRDYGMMNDFSISQYEFTEAMESLIRNLDKNDLYKLINEMDDKTTNKISIKKFQEVYNAIAAETPSTGRGYDDDYDKNLKFKEMLRTIAGVVGSKHFSYDDFFSKYGYNRNMMTMSETKFDQALDELHLRLTPDDIRILKKELDPSRTGVMSLSQLFDIKPDSSLQTSYLDKAPMNPKEKEDLRHLLDEVSSRIKKKDIDLQAQFTRYDIKKEGYLSSDEFIYILKENSIGVGTQDQDLFFKAYGDPKTKKISYRQFCNAIQDNALGASTLAKSEMTKSISPAVLDEKQRLLFKGIREQYANLEELFKAYDRNNDDAISKPEFIQMIKDLKTPVNSDEMEALYERIDTKHQGKVYFVNLSLAFKNLSEEDSKTIAGQIVRAFVTEGRSLFEVMANFPKTGDHMKFMDFLDGLQSVSRKIGLKDIQFLLSFFTIKLTLQRDINVVEFADALQSFALRMRLINDIEAERVFTREQRRLAPGKSSGYQEEKSISPKKGSNLIDKFKIKLGLSTREKVLEFWRLLDRNNDKSISLSEFKRTINKMNSDFSDSELNQIFRELDVADKGMFTSSDFLEALTANNQSQVISPKAGVMSPKSGHSGMRSPSTLDIIERTKGAKDVFINIMQMLDERKEKFSSYFYAPDQRLNIIEAKLRLNKLGVKMNEQVSELLNDLCDEMQPNLVNMNYFEKCYNYHKDKYEMGGNQMKRPTDPYREIRDALRRKGLTFNNAFSKIDYSGKGYISTGAFKTVVSEDLLLYLDPEVIRAILRETADDEGRVSLGRLRDGIEMDDYGGNGGKIGDKLSQINEEVEELLGKLRTAMKNNKMTVERMYEFFDINKNSMIDYEEFQKMILKLDSNLPLHKINKLFKFMDKSQDGRITPQEFRSCFESTNDKGDRAFESLKKMLKKYDLEPERAFEVFDRNQNGTIEFSEFSEVLDKYDVSLSPDDKNYLFRKFDENQNGKISRGEFLRHFESSHGKQADNDAKIKVLLEDLRNQLRSKNRTDTARLFQLVDTNRDEKVQPKEFIEFAQMINPSIKTSEAMDMFKIIDLNKDNVLSYSEFSKHFNVNNFEFENDWRKEEGEDRGKKGLEMLKRALRDRRIDADQAFKKFDRNYNRYVEFREFEEGLEIYDVRLTHEEKNAAFRKLDVNRDGRIPEREFIKQLEDRGPEVPETNPKIKRLLDDVKYTLKSKNRNDLSRLFEIVDTNNNNRVSQQEFIQFIRNVDPSVLTNEALEMFKIVDTNHDEIISYSEFNDYFNANHYDLPPRGGSSGGGLSAGIIDRARWAEELFEEMNHVLKLEQTTFNDHFFSPDEKLDKNLFRKRLLMLGMDLPPDNFDRFFKNFQNAREMDKIDLPDLKMCFAHYKDAGRLSYGALRNKRLNQVLKEIKSAINREGYTVPKFINGLDNRHYGTCTRPELKNMLVDRLRIPDNVNLKFLYEAAAKEGDDKTINLNKLDHLIADGVSDTLQPVQGESYRDAEATLKSIRSSIERTGISSEQIYKRFNANQDSSISYEEFYNGIRNLDPSLSRADIKGVFDILDRERNGSISKFKFMTSFGKIDTKDIPVYLKSSRPLFQEVNRLLVENKLDLYRVMKPHKNLIDKNDFRQGMFLVGINVDRQERELQGIQEVLLEGRAEGLNFEALEECLKRAQEPEPVERPPHSGVFTPQDVSHIEKMFQEIAKFMKVDNITFDQLFMSKDYKKNGTISEKDLRSTLINDLYISENPKLDLLIEYVKNKTGEIDLVNLRKHLNQGGESIAPVLSLDQFVKAIKEKFQHNIDHIIKYFDYNSNKQISRKEFVDCCKQAINTDKELALFYFSQLDIKNAGEITTAHFRDVLETDDTDKRGLLKRLRLFVIDNKNYLLKNMDSLDVERTKSLNLNQIKVALSNSQFSTTVEELTDLIGRLGIKKDMRDRYNYQEFVDTIMHTDHQKQELADVDQLLARLKTQATAKGLDLVALFKVHDVRGNQTITLKSVYEELDRHDIHLNKDEKNLLLPLLNPINDSIKYYDLTNLIFNGRNPDTGKHAFLVEASWAKSLVLAIKDAMKRNNTTTVRLFGLKQHEEYLPVGDFVSGLDYLGIKRSNAEWKKFTELLVHPAQPDRVSIPMFEYLLDNMEDVSEYSDADAKILDKRFAQLRDFMREDKQNFQRSFP